MNGFKGTKKGANKNKMFMKRKIVVEHGEQLVIAKIMGCTKEMVCYALSYKKHTLLAQKIRKVALERGGVEVVLRDVAKQRAV